MTQFILTWIAAGGYAGIFALMVLENVFPPVPSEIIMGFGGVLVARGEMHFLPLLLVGTAGTVVGNGFWYWLGCRWKEHQLKAFIEKHGRWLTFEWHEFEAARAKFRRHGDWIVFLLRFSPFLRTIISLPAGFAKMKLWRFVLFTFLGSLVWNSLLILGGTVLSSLIIRFENVAEWVVVLFLAGGAGWYLYRVIRWQPTARELVD